MGQISKLLLFSKKVYCEKQPKEVWIYDFLFCNTYSSMNIKEHVLFPTYIAHNLESESQAAFFFLCILSPILEVFPVQLQCPPYLYNVKVFKICPGMYAILELSVNLHNPNSLELQSSPCTHCLPVIWGFFAGQLSGAKGTKYFFV